VTRAKSRQRRLTKDLQRNRWLQRRAWRALVSANVPAVLRRGLGSRTATRGGRAERIGPISL